MVQHFIGLAAAAAALLPTILGVGSFLAQRPLGALADRYDPSTLLHGCIGILTLAAMLLPLTGTSLVWLVWVVAALWGGSGGGT